MKISITKLSSSLFALTLSLSVFAKPVAHVTELKGSVFLVDAQGETSILKANQVIEDRSEILVEEGASVTLNDYYDATYHLIGGTHLKFFDKSVQLKKGKTWIQSWSSRHPLSLMTANGHVDYLKGEFITTFDQATNRSQVLVVNGEVEVSNILNRDLGHTVPAGTFTVVDPEIDNGVPRSPTTVGLQSLNVALMEFKKLPDQIRETTVPARNIASVSEEKDVKKGEIIYIISNRTPASVRSGKSKVVKKKSDYSPVPIKIYGRAFVKPEGELAPRSPASIYTEKPSLPKLTVPAAHNDPEFTQSLKKHEAEQPKYSKELQRLIDELKSY